MSFKNPLLFLCLYLLSVALPTQAWAQTDDDSTPVYAFFLKFDDAKEQKSLAKEAMLVTSGDQVLVVGEVAIEGKLKLGEPAKLYQVSLARKAKISSTLAEAPYEYDKDGKRKLISKFKKNLISVPAKHLQVIAVGGGSGFKRATVSDFGLYSLCSDLERRRLEVQELRDVLKGLKQSQNPEEWKAARNQLLRSWESLVSYVENFPLFEPMGGTLRAEFNSAQQKIQDEEKSDRIEEFKASVKNAKVEEVDLEAPVGLKFHQIETKHIRIVYLLGERGITDEYAKELALLGEQTIELFRSVAIDPFPTYAEEQDSDLPIIPNFIFQEYFMGPDDTATHQALFSRQYGREISDPRVFEVMSTGTTLQGSREEPLFLSYSKNQPGSMKGLVVHQLGHSLSSLHYNHSDARSVRPALPVIQESVSRYLCFEKLGSNNLRCTNFNVAKYEKQDLGDEKTKVLLGDSYMERFFKLSLRAPALEECAIVPLNKLNELHMAKGWMTYYFIINNDGFMGQQWLRKCHDAVTKQGDGDRTGLDRNVWRDSTKELVGEGKLEGDPLHMYEDRLKQAAEDAINKKK